MRSDILYEYTPSSNHYLAVITQGVELCEIGEINFHTPFKNAFKKSTYAYVVPLFALVYWTSPGNLNYIMQ